MLTHVSMWKKGKWTKTTVKEAADLFPYTVSVNKKLFMCELCGQYVTLTGPGSVARHFKHSRGETDKECEERSLSYEITPLNDSERSLTIKIEVEEKKCNFLIGFPAILNSVAREMQNEHVIIEYGLEKRKYSIERFNTEQSTFFSVGTVLEDEYEIKYSNAELKEECGFPEISEGYAGKGRLFDHSSGIMLPFDADVSVGNKYYFLTKEYLTQMQEPFVKKKMDLNNGFKLYEMMPTALDQKNAVFFLDLRARLTNMPLRVLTIWPPVKRIEDTVMHCQKDILTLLFGDVKISLNNCLMQPVARDRDTWSLFRFQIRERRANLLIGRSRVLKSNQFLLSDRVSGRNDPKVELYDINDTLIGELERVKPPPQKRAILKSEYDGYAVVYDNRRISYVELNAGQDLEINDIDYGTRIQVFIGNQLEREYTIRSKDSITHEKENERNLYNKLLKAKSTSIPVSHAVRGALASKYKDTKIRNWIRRQGNRMPEDALVILKQGIE